MDLAALHRIQPPWIRPPSTGSSRQGRAHHGSGRPPSDPAAGWHARHGSSRIRGEGEGLRRPLMEESRAPSRRWSHGGRGGGRIRDATRCCCCSVLSGGAEPPCALPDAGSGRSHRRELGPRSRQPRTTAREPSWGRVEERGRVGEGARREGRGGGVSGAGRGGEETGGREDGRGRGIGRVRADKGIVVLWSYCEGI